MVERRFERLPLVYHNEKSTSYSCFGKGIEKINTLFCGLKTISLLEFEDVSGLIKIGASDDAQAYRVINFCDVETKTEFRLVTNLPESGDAALLDAPRTHPH